MNLLQCIGLTLMVVGLFGSLWEWGWLPVTTKRALVFTGRVYGKGPIRLRMSAATGTLRRKIPLREGSHTFTLDSSLSAGTVTAILRDQKAKRQWQLTQQFPCVTVTTENGGFGKGYLLILQFQKASGDITLTWQ